MWPSIFKILKDLGGKTKARLQQWLVKKELSCQSHVPVSLDVMWTTFMFGPCSDLTKEGSLFCLDPSSLVWPCVMLVFCEVVLFKRTLGPAVGAGPAPGSQRLPSQQTQGVSEKEAKVPELNLPFRLWRSGILGVRAALLNPVNMMPEPHVRRQETRRSQLLCPHEATLWLPLFFSFLYTWLVMLKFQRQQVWHSYVSTDKWLCGLHLFAFFYCCFCWNVSGMGGKLLGIVTV